MSHEAKQPGLATLGELKDYRVAEGSPDIRRWEVFGADSRRLGEVRELLVDTRAMKARYMIVHLDRGLPGPGQARDAVVPLGRARLDDTIDRVYLEDVTITTADTLPDYEAGAFTPEREHAPFGGGDVAQREQEHARFFGRRRTDHAAAYVESTAAPQPVTQAPQPVAQPAQRGAPPPVAKTAQPLAQAPPPVAKTAQPVAQAQPPQPARPLQPEVLGEAEAAGFEPGAEPVFEGEPKTVISEEVVVHTTRVTVEAPKKKEPV